MKEGPEAAVSIPFPSQIFLKIPVSFIRNPSVSDENINSVPFFIVLETANPSPSN